MNSTLEFFRDWRTDDWVAVIDNEEIGRFEYTKMVELPEPQLPLLMWRSEMERVFQDRRDRH